ncbi:DUF883 domain-containing protein [Sulfitobacter sp. JL08]|nr:DUF883 domain-containing protein [Sulfitobacter sp. JL08]
MTVENEKETTMASTQKKSNGSVSAPTAEDLGQQLETLKADIVSITQSLGDMAKAQGNDLSAAAKERVADAKAKGSEHIADLNAQAEHLGAQAGEFVHRKPAVALGMAAGLGFLVGLMSQRR